MKQTVKYVVSQFVGWLLFFIVVQKPLFVVYNLHFGKQMSIAEMWRIYVNGFPVDVTAAGYLMIVPLLMCWLALLLRANPTRWLRVYNIVITVMMALITVADACLYEFWEYKLDNTVLYYIDDPKNAFASVSAGYIATRLVMLVAVGGVIHVMLSWPLKLLRGLPSGESAAWWKICLAMLVLSVLNLVAIRGLGIYPNMPYRVYYSDVQFYNHSAVNPLANVVYSLATANDFDREFQCYDDAEVERAMARLFPTESDSTEVILSNRRPDIVVVMVESFGSGFIKSLGGMDNVAPRMSALCDSSVCFTRCYGASFRTERGLAGAISGYLAQPTTNIMRYTHKVHNLPGLPKSLKAAGYRTQFIYGGDASFFNMNDWMAASGHDKIVTENDFDASERTQEWGVPDHVPLDYLLKDLTAGTYDKSKPRYTTLLTLSSHMPFDVPYHRLDDKKLNAFAYTDSCLGNFVDRLKVSPAWDNLLLIILADHNFNNHRMDEEDFPFIPLLLTGGAVKVAPRRIDVLMSQTDLPAIVLGQLGLNHDEFIFSRDVLARNYVYPFAFNAFNNGFNLRDSTGCTVWDTAADRAIHGDDSRRSRTGKIILQSLYKDMGRR